MKLTDALICAQCDEIVKREADMNKQTCPSCTSTVLTPIARWVRPAPSMIEVATGVAVAIERERLRMRENGHT